MAQTKIQTVMIEDFEIDVAATSSVSAWGTVGTWADEVVGGWTGIINGVTNPSKINGILVANIIKVNGII